MQKNIKMQNCKKSKHVKKNEKIKGSLQKKNGESWESVPTSLTPPLANLGILNCYFFIGYLGLIDHEMDFEMNLFFSLTKVV